MATHRVQLGTTARAASRWPTEADLMYERRGESLAVFVSEVTPKKCIAQVSKGLSVASEGAICS
jgi:hypothetical protein